MKEPKQKLIITKKLKGDDGHKTFSIRIKDETVERLDEISKKNKPPSLWTAVCFDPLFYEDQA